MNPIRQPPATATPRRLAALLLAAATASPIAAQNFPPPPTPSGNPTTAAKAELGRALFWEEQMSSTRTVACGTCHVFAAGGADPRASIALAPGLDGAFGTADDVHGSPGVPSTTAGGSYAAVAAFDLDPQVTPRLAPSVVNAAYQAELFWDGRARGGVFRDPITNQIVLNGNASLEVLIAQPPLNTVEMGHPGRTWGEVAARLAAARPLALADQLPASLQAFVQGRTYPQLFQQVFGTADVTPARVVMAIAAYLRTLVADRSPFDQFQFAGAPALPLAAQRGLGVFLRGCNGCHTNILLFAAGPSNVEFRNSGVRPTAEDQGRLGVTGLPADSARFKVPDLRNVALRPRFFHNGGPATLAAVVDFYNRGGDFHVNQDPAVPALAGTMTAQDRADVVAFLQTLTDARVQNETPPFDRPRLYSESTRVPQTIGAPSGPVSPRAVALEPPLLGNPAFTQALTDVPPGSLGVWFVDAAVVPGGVPALGITVHLAGTGAMQAFLAPQLATPSPTGNGALSLTLAVPADAALTGAVLYGQWAALTPTSQLAASAAVRLQLF